MDLKDNDKSTNGLHERLIFLLLEDQKGAALKTAEIEIILLEIPSIRDRIAELEASKISKPMFLIRLQANIARLLVIAVAGAAVSWVTGVTAKLMEFLK
jgi:hypothetical protein